MEEHVNRAKDRMTALAENLKGKPHDLRPTAL
jgi:hypothetical protein